MNLQSIGILSIGEMGHACARVLLRHGARVVTVVNGRSERTRALAKDAGVEVVDAMKTLLDSVDVVLSLVTPSSARAVCRTVAEAMRGRRDAPLYIDANPISPTAAAEMAKVIASVGGRFVDGAVIGSATLVGQSTTLYLSGPDAAALREIETYGLRVKVVGGEVGQASALKIFYAGLNKGIAALLIELLVGARRAGILDDVVDLYNGGFRDLVKRMDAHITSNSLHARRRSEEMVELADALRHWGMEPVMTGAVRDLLARIGALGLPAIEPEPDAYRNLLQALVDNGFLARR